MTIIYFTKLTDQSRNEIVEDCENVACVAEIDQIEAEIAKCMISYNEAKHEYQAALIENLRKDLILHKLLNQEKEDNFDEFSDRLSANTLVELRSLSKAEKCDSTFILTAMRGLYNQNLSALKNKTYSGASKNNTKESISPENIKCLNDIFQKRLDNIADLGINNERKKKFPKYVKNAIESINKANK